ncbi:MAG: response regulator transcription factor [Gammaproteobacteria bacterium]|nr:response regulator transcription factor [Gammaproteobacteria bacterium]
MRILIIEDEDKLREQLVERLRGQGYAVDAAVDGEEGLYYGTEYPLDAAIIDLGLPKLSGLDVIQKLREQGRDFPIMILTARGRWQEKVDGLGAGADDYVVKPFHIEEVLARLKALLRRAAGVAQSKVTCDPICLDTTSQEVSVDGQLLDLTGHEYRLLEYLMLNSGKLVSKSELTEHIYDEDTDRDSNVIEVFVGRLRKKLDPRNNLKPIETLRGRGYRFSLPRTT